jgi:anti-sigma regulatory factor (Ser/Thr protein kinase)
MAISYRTAGRFWATKKHGMAPEEFWHVAATPDAPRKARSWLYEALQVWDVDDPSLLADVLTSELVTNAVRHTGSTNLVLRLIWKLGRLRVEVEDEGGGDVLVEHADPRGGHGYGLLLVDHLSDAWGWEPTPSGKRVWFEVVARRC